MSMDEFPSPDGRFCVVLHPVEMRMSHWVLRPTLEAGGQRLLDLSDTLWSADHVEWSADGQMVTLRLRRYPGDKYGARVQVDPWRLSAIVEGESGEQAELPLAALEIWLEDYYKRSPKW